MKNSTTLWLFSFLTILYCLIASVVGIVWRYAYEEYYFCAYPLIPFFYLLLWGVNVYLIVKDKFTEKLYLGCRGIKFGATLLGIAVLYGFCEYPKRVLLAVAIFYLISLIIETYFEFSTLNKKR